MHEGADIVLVKPSLFYTDIIKEYASGGGGGGVAMGGGGDYRKKPVAAYLVSGEYVMLWDYGAKIKNTKSVVEE